MVSAPSNSTLQNRYIYIYAQTVGDNNLCGDSAREREREGQRKLEIKKAAIWKMPTSSNDDILKFYIQNMGWNIDLDGWEVCTNASIMSHTKRILRLRSSLNAKCNKWREKRFSLCDACICWIYLCTCVCMQCAYFQCEDFTNTLYASCMHNQENRPNISCAQCTYIEYFSWAFSFLVWFDPPKPTNQWLKHIEEIYKVACIFTISWLAIATIFWWLRVSNLALASHRTP